MRIPINNLKPQNDAVEKKVFARLKKLVADSNFVEGEALEEFEQKFAKFCGVKFCHGVGSGTDALRTALLACGVGAGDEVITTPISYVSTSLAIAQLGARPVFVDVDTKGNMDPTNIEAVITKKTKAILPVHMYGNPCDMAAIKKIAKKYGLLVIDDCSHSQGAWHGKKRIGSLADISCFSFYPSKNLGAWGDAGCVTTNDKELAIRAYIFKNYGEYKDGRNFPIVIGYNSKLDPMQAVVLSEKLGHLDDWNQRRRDIAARYDKELKGIKDLTLLSFGSGASYYVFPVRVNNREEFRKFLSGKGIGNAVHYPAAIHLVDAFKYLGYKKGDFPNAERHAAEILSLPFYPFMPEKHQAKVIKAVKEFFHQ